MQLITNTPCPVQRACRCQLVLLTLVLFARRSGSLNGPPPHKTMSHKYAGIITAPETQADNYITSGYHGSIAAQDIHQLVGHTPQGSTTKANHTDDRLYMTQSPVPRYFIDDLQRSPDRHLDDMKPPGVQRGASSLKDNGLRHTTGGELSASMLINQSATGFTNARPHLHDSFSKQNEPNIHHPSEESHTKQQKSKVIASSFQTHAVGQIAVEVFPNGTSWGSNLHHRSNGLYQEFAYHGQAETGPTGPLSNQGRRHNVTSNQKQQLIHTMQYSSSHRNMDDVRTKTSRSTQKMVQQHKLQELHKEKAGHEEEWEKDDEKKYEHKRRLEQGHVQKSNTVPTQTIYKYGQPALPKWYIQKLPNAQTQPSSKHLNEGAALYGIGLRRQRLKQLRAMRAMRRNARIERRRLRRLRQQQRRKKWRAAQKASQQQQQQQQQAWPQVQKLKLQSSQSFKTDAPKHEKAKGTDNAQKDGLPKPQQPHWVAS